MATNILTNGSRTRWRPWHGQVSVTVVGVTDDHESQATSLALAAQVVTGRRCIARKGHLAVCKVSTKKTGCNVVSPFVASSSGRFLIKSLYQRPRFGVSIDSPLTGAQLCMSQCAPCCPGCPFGHGHLRPHIVFYVIYRIF